MMQYLGITEEHDMRRIQFNS